MHTRNTFPPQFVLFPLGDKLILLGHPVREGNCCWTVLELELVYWETSSCGDKPIPVGISSLVCGVSLELGTNLLVYQCCNFFVEFFTLEFVYIFCVVV